MPVISILIFIVTFLIVALAIIYLLVKYYNKKNLVAIEKFVSHASELRPILLQNIKLRYWITNRARTRSSPNNHCDIYLFDDLLAIVRRQNFIFKVFFAPVLITSHIASTKSIFNYLSVYKPARITFNQIVKGEIDIKIKDPIYGHYKIDITFKGLTSEQLTQLIKIKNWC